MDHSEYIAVDHDAMNGVIRFRTPNMKFYGMSIQRYIEDHLDDLDLRCTFAICSAVPDRDAEEAVIEYFPNYLCWYPGGKTHMKLEVR